MVSLYTDGLDFGFQTISELWILYIYIDILYIYTHIIYTYLYSMVSTDTDHIRFLQIVIDDYSGLAGTYGCFNRQPSQGGVHRHYGSGRLAQVYSMPYKNNGI